LRILWDGAWTRWKSTCDVIRISGSSLNPSGRSQAN